MLLSFTGFGGWTELNGIYRSVREASENFGKLLSGKGWWGSACRISFLNGATFAENRYLWASELSVGCQTFSARDKQLLFAVATDFCFELLVPPDADSLIGTCGHRRIYVYWHLLQKPACHVCVIWTGQLQAGAQQNQDSALFGLSPSICKARASFHMTGDVRDRPWRGHRKKTVSSSCQHWGTWDEIPRVREQCMVLPHAAE